MPSATASSAGLTFTSSGFLTHVLAPDTVVLGWASAGSVSPRGGSDVSGAGAGSVGAASGQVPAAGGAATGTEGAVTVVSTKGDMYDNQKFQLIAALLELR